MSVALWALIATGCLLRVVRYADNRSFWLDESLLGLNLINRSASGLADALDFVQSAPYGFLLAEKGAVAWLGDSELSLRLIPLLSSLAGLVVFGLVARRLLDPPGAALAAALFALGEPLIYQASEAKPYTSDVLAAVAIVWLSLRADDQRSVPALARWAIAFGVLGIAAVWVSYPSVFVLAAAGPSILLRAAFTRETWRLPVLLVLGGIWLAAFVVSYTASAERLASVRESVFGGSEPLGAQISGTIRVAWYTFSDPGGFYPPLRLVAFLCLGLGLVALARERFDRVLLLAGPGVLAIAATLLSKYPLSGRFSLFLAPLGYLVIARGAQWLWELGRRRTLIAVSLVLALVGAQTVWSAEAIVDPPRREHVRPLLQTLRDGWRSGDTLYVYRNAQYALRWYAECVDCGVRPFPFDLYPAPPGSYDATGEPVALLSAPPSVIVGREGGDDGPIGRTVQALAGKTRVWFLFSHFMLHPPGPSDEQRFLRAIDRNGQRIRSWHQPGASLYLADLSRG